MANASKQFGFYHPAPSHYKGKAVRKTDTILIPALFLGWKVNRYEKPCFAGAWTMHAFVCMSG